MQSAPSPDTDDRVRRRHLLVCAGLVIAAGLFTHAAGSGPVADALGDALYAVMIYLVIATVLPRAGFWLVGATALAICMLIELFQLTGLPAVWAQSFWPARLVFGAGFDVRDLVAYALGAGAAALCDLVVRRVRSRG